MPLTLLSKVPHYHSFFLHSQDAPLLLVKSDYCNDDSVICIARGGAVKIVSSTSAVWYDVTFNGEVSDVFKNFINKMRL